MKQKKIMIAILLLTVTCGLFCYKSILAEMEICRRNCKELTEIVENIKQKRKYITIKNTFSPVMSLNCEYKFNVPLFYSFPSTGIIKPFIFLIPLLN